MAQNAGVFAADEATVTELAAALGAAGYSIAARATLTDASAIATELAAWTRNDTLAVVIGAAGPVARQAVMPLVTRRLLGFSDLRDVDGGRCGNTIVLLVPPSGDAMTSAVANLLPRLEHELTSKQPPAQPPRVSIPERPAVSASTTKHLPPVAKRIPPVPPAPPPRKEVSVMTVLPPAPKQGSGSIVVPPAPAAPRKEVSVVAAIPPIDDPRRAPASRPTPPPAPPSRPTPPPSPASRATPPPAPAASTPRRPTATTPPPVPVVGGKAPAPTPPQPPAKVAARSLATEELDPADLQLLRQSAPEIAAIVEAPKSIATGSAQIDASHQARGRGDVDGAPAPESGGTAIPATAPTTDSSGRRTSADAAAATSEGSQGTSDLGSGPRRGPPKPPPGSSATSADTSGALAADAAGAAGATSASTATSEPRASADASKRADDAASASAASATSATASGATSASADDVGTEPRKAPPKPPGKRAEDMPPPVVPAATASEGASLFDSSATSTATATGAAAPTSRRRGPGLWIVLGAGVLVAGGIAYAVLGRSSSKTAQVADRGTASSTTEKPAPTPPTGGDQAAGSASDDGSAAAGSAAGSDDSAVIEFDDTDARPTPATGSGARTGNTGRATGTSSTGTGGTAGTSSGTSASGTSAGTTGTTGTSGGKASGGKQTGSAATTPTTAEAPVAADGCDKVSCVIDAYARPCCEQYRPRSKDAPPVELDKAMITAGMAKAKAAVIRCGEQSPTAKGIVRIAMKVAPDGSVTDASVAESPDATLGECVASAVRKVSFASTEQGGSFAYPFKF